MKNKKIIAMGMTLLMTAAPAATVSALPVNNNYGDSIDSSNPATDTLPDFETEETAVGGKETINDEMPDSQGEIAVSGKYQTYVEAAEVISVDLSWDALNFTYAAEQQGTWNPLDHSYTGDKDSGWVNNSAEIRVANHSNTALTACLDYDAAEGSTATGSFSSSVLGLKNAEIVSLGEPEDAPSASTTFTVGGTIETTAPLGTITVALKDAVPVTDVSILKEAFENGGVVTLIGTTAAGSANETGTDIETVINLNDQALNLNTISVYTGSKVTLSGPGTIGSKQNNGAFVVSGGSVVFENCNVSVSYKAATIEAGSIVVRGGTYSSTGNALFNLRGAGCSMDIESGTFNGVDNYPIFTISGGSLNISGGTFIAGSTNGTLFADNTGGNAVSITGGSFNQDPSDYVADGYEAVYNESTGYYDVTRKPD